MSDYFDCPHCGGEVPYGASACPHCGSDEHTGWSDEAEYGGFVAGPDEPGPSSKPSSQRRFLIIAVTLLILSAFLASSVSWGIYLVPIFLILLAGSYYLTDIRPRSRKVEQRQLYQQLLRRARGDQATVARLIEYERQRAPFSDETELMQNAIDRWERDAR